MQPTNSRRSEPTWRKGRPLGLNTKWGDRRKPCPRRGLVPLPFPQEDDVWDEDDSPGQYLSANSVPLDRDEEVS